MSKRSKRNNKHKNQSSGKKEVHSSTAVEETKAASLDKHLDDLALESIQTPAVDLSETTTEKVVDASFGEMEAEGTSNKAAWAFVWGLVIGAVIVSVLF